MARGCGLSIDSDPSLSSSFSLFKPFVLNSFPLHEDHLQPPMDSSLPFPEMDFFSTSNNSNLNPSSSNADSSIPPHPLEFKVNTGLNLLTTNSDQSLGDDELAVCSNFRAKRAKVDELKTEIVVLRAELEEMMGENHKLKGMLDKAKTDYNALKVHVELIESPNGGEKPGNKALDVSPEGNESNNRSGSLVPRQFIDLGFASIDGVGDHQTKSRTDEPSNSRSSSALRRSSGRSRSPLEVGSRNKKEFNKEAEIDEEANKVQKYSPPQNIDEQVEATMRKARVSVRAFSEASMISDGCQWRKYGQKMAKGNPCPRAYYRCTMGPGCPVRKQVQRSAENKKILVTTYEGNHNHALPPAAMAMAQTTEAAAKTLLSGSMSSGDGLMNGSFLTRTTMLPCSSSNIATLSASAPFPTVTLDLTVPPTTQPSTQFSTPFSNNNNNNNSASHHSFSQVLAQALCGNNHNQSTFSGLQMNNKDLLPFSATIAANPNFTAALTVAITSIMGSALPKNVNADGSCNVTASGNNNDSSFLRN